MPDNLKSSRTIKEIHLLKLAITILLLSAIFTILNFIWNDTLLNGDLTGLFFLINSLLILFFVLNGYTNAAKFMFTFVLPLGVFANTINGYYLNFNILWIPIALLTLVNILFIIYEYPGEKM